VFYAVLYCTILHVYDVFRYLYYFLKYVLSFQERSKLQSAEYFCICLYCATSCCSLMLFIYGLKNFYPRWFDDNWINYVIINYKLIFSYSRNMILIIYIMCDVFNKNKIILLRKPAWFFKLKRLWRERNLTIKEALNEKSLTETRCSERMHIFINRHQRPVI